MRSLDDGKGFCEFSKNFFAELLIISSRLFRTRQPSIRYTSIKKKTFCKRNFLAFFEKTLYFLNSAHLFIYPPFCIIPCMQLIFSPKHSQDYFRRWCWWWGELDSEELLTRPRNVFSLLQT